MKSDGLARHLFAAAAITLVLYVAGYYWIESGRQAKGPWEVTFRADDEGRPSLTVFQPALGVSNVTVTVTDKTVTNRNVEVTVRFDTVTNTAPVGELIYFDTTFLPGVVTFNLLGHEIEFMPRTMVLDKKEVPWVSGNHIQLSGEGKYRPEDRKMKSRYSSGDR